jgi:hypothetical protein
MPTTRKKRTRQYQGVLNEDQEQDLIFGIALACAFPFINDTERKKLYFLHRDFLFSKSEQYEHGKRPDAYYDYEEDRE